MRHRRVLFASVSAGDAIPIAFTNPDTQALDPKRTFEAVAKRVSSSIGVNRSGPSSSSRKQSAPPRCDVPVARAKPLAGASPDAPWHENRSEARLGAIPKRVLLPDEHLALFLDAFQPAYEGRDIAAQRNRVGQIGGLPLDDIELLDEPFANTSLVVWRHQFADLRNDVVNKVRSQDLVHRLEHGPIDVWHGNLDNVATNRVAALVVRRACVKPFRRPASARPLSGVQPAIAPGTPPEPG